MSTGPLSLSNEVLLMILKSAPDLPTLYSLICTHSVFAKVFDLDSARIVESIISASLHKKLQPFPRWMAILGSLKTSHSTYRPGPTPGITLKDFTRRYKELHPSGRPNFVPEILPSLTGTEGPRYALIVAARIQRLENICLVQMLDNIKDMKLSYPEDANFQFNRSWASKQFPPSVSFNASATWAPSWVERHRVQRALWQLMASWNAHITFAGLPLDMGDLRNNSEYWRQTFRDGADFSTGLLVGKWLRPDFQGDVLDSVNDTLHGVLGCSPTLFFISELKGDQSVPAKRNLSAMYDRTLKIAAYEEWAQQPEPRDNMEGKILGQTQRNLKSHNYAMGFFFTKYCDIDALTTEPLM